MHPLPSPLLTVSASATSGPPVTQWRLLSGGAVASADIREIDMFSSDASTTDLCTGGTASSNTGTAANMFDENSATSCNIGNASGAYAGYTFAAPQTVVSFAIKGNSTGSSTLPNTVKLQYYNGASWVDATAAITWTSNCTPSIQYGRYYSDSTAEFEHLTTTTSSASGSSFAAKGHIVDVVKSCSVQTLKVLLNSTTSESYKVVAALLNTSTNAITSILGSSSVQTVSSTATYTFTLTSPISLTAGQRVAFIVVRTDGTSTSINRIDASGSAGDTGPIVTHYGFVRYATTNPSVGDSVLNTTASAARMSIFCRIAV